MINLRELSEKTPEYIEMIQTIKNRGIFTDKEIQKMLDEQIEKDKLENKIE